MNINAQEKYFIAYTAVVYATVVIYTLPYVDICSMRRERRCNIIQDHNYKATNMKG